MPRVIDREELTAVPYGILVCGPLVGTDIAPVTLQVTSDKAPWVFLRLDERHKGARTYEKPADGESRCDDMHTSSFLLNKVLKNRIQSRGRRAATKGGTVRHLEKE